MNPDVGLPRRRLRLRFRLIVLISLALAVAGSLTAWQSFHSARTPSQKASPHRKHSQPLAVQQTEPVQWAGTFGSPTSSTTETAEATNWTGHIFAGPAFTAVSGQWVVPAVQPSATGAYSSTWLGVDGVSNTSLIQAGTATISIADLTSGQSFSQAFAYNGPATSAEWIEESPKVNGQPSVLASFGTMQFTSMAWDGANPSSVVNTTLNMADSSGNVIASSGAIASNSFTIAG